ncbi:MAG: hypothetical protein OXI87_12105 [Albidovulum sp.]|nr:hypothetical protein [Albidovulum sp.]MDE0533675.1 hypothetical protein [Albidovulum sp.]
MDLAAGLIPAVSFRHEAAAAVLVVEPAFRHRDTGSARHAGFGEFDPAESFRITSSLSPLF